MQSGGGVKTGDTSTLNSLCGYAWVYVQTIFLFSSSTSIPGFLRSHTLDLVQNVNVVLDEALGWGRERELCVKCLLEMHSFPYFPNLYHLVSCLCFQLCIILFASCTKLIFSKV
uniref:Uncharacterized protein n=1 Tax=Gorilla gorilla gorilla TaxID=9595 RepID=A0A2I2YTH9_GORGO